MADFVLIHIVLAVELVFGPGLKPVCSEPRLPTPFNR